MNPELERELVEDVISFSREMARKFKVSLNPDEEHVRKVAKGLVKNYEKYGHYFCPCRVVTGDLDLDIKNDCPCVYVQREIYEKGQCHCALFVRV